MVPSTTFQENWSGKWPNGPTTSVSNWTVSPTLMRRAPLSWPWHENNRRNCFFQKDTASPLCKLSNQLGRLTFRRTIFAMLTLGPTLNYKRGIFVKWKPETHIIAHWFPYMGCTQANIRLKTKNRWIRVGRFLWILWLNMYGYIWWYCLPIWITTWPPAQCFNRTLKPTQLAQVPASMGLF